MLFFAGMVVGVAIGMVLMAALMLATMLTRQEERYCEGTGESVAVDAGDGDDGAGAAAAEQLTQAEERADFYYRLYTGK